MLEIDPDFGLGSSGGGGDSSTGLATALRPCRAIKSLKRSKS